MKIEDLFTGQTVAVVAKNGTVKQGSLGYILGFSESHQKALIHLFSGAKVYLNLKEIIGIVEVVQ